MASDIMLLTLMCGITLIAYMIAINAHGPIRLSLSYLIATILLAGTVWAIVQHVNIGMDSMNLEKLRKLESEKNTAEARMLSQEEALKVNKERMSFAAKLNKAITQGTALATSLNTANLQDKSVELDVLVRRATSMKKQVDSAKVEFEKLASADAFFSEPLTLIKEGIQLLAESAMYYQQYYYSEDGDQEATRELIMRQKAKSAYEKFQKASVLIASSA